MSLRHAIAAVATLAAALVCVAAPQALAQDEQLAQAQQGCADRWDWMNFSYQPAGTEAIITSTSPCQLSLNYGDNGNGGFAVLPCEVNGFGAWACASHAHEIMEAPVAWNASVDGAGRLVLTAPPATPLVTKRPKWTTRYTVTNGYIVPFDKRGRLRKGLRLHGKATGIDGCGVGLKLKTRQLTCVTGYTCFAKRLPLRARDAIACPDEPGSTRFRRGIALPSEW